MVQGVIYNDPLSPALLNAMLYTLIRHCILVMAVEEVSSNSFGRVVQTMTKFLYANNSRGDQLPGGALQPGQDSYKHWENSMDGVPDLLRSQETL